MLWCQASMSHIIFRDFHSGPSLGHDPRPLVCCDCLSREAAPLPCIMAALASGVYRLKRWSWIRVTVFCGSVLSDLGFISLFCLQHCLPSSTAFMYRSCFSFRLANS
jgi:hypothetical protein